MVDVTIHPNLYGDKISSVEAKTIGLHHFVQMEAVVPVEWTIFCRTHNEAERLADLMNEIAGKTRNEMAEALSEETIKTLEEVTHGSH
jgi:hypothetical protein